MPAFSQVLKGNIQDIVAYLFNNKQAKKKINKKTPVSAISNLLAKRGRPADIPFYRNVTGQRRWTDKKDRSAIKPPWGLLGAININTGDYEWQIPVGNRPKLQKKGAPPTGTLSSPGPIVTAGGLVFISGTRDHKLRAYDKATGKLLWKITLPSVGSGTPCTYIVDGKQYVALVVAGTKDNPGGSLVAFALP